MMSNFSGEGGQKSSKIVRHYLWTFPTQLLTLTGLGLFGHLGCVFKKKCSLSFLNFLSNEDHILYMKAENSR